MAKPTVLAVCLAMLLAAAGLARAEPIVLRADRVFTSEDRQAHAGWVVVVDADRILQAGPAGATRVPPQARVVDLRGATLLPGLIDAHSHLFLHPYNEALWDDQVLKEAINDGIVPGPRLWVVTRAIVAAGAYGPARRDYNGDRQLPQGAQEASGVEDVVRAVREQAADGADWIKVYADYRVGPAGATRPTFSVEELKALVDTAHDLG